MSQKKEQYFEPMFGIQERFFGFMDAMYLVLRNMIPELEVSEEFIGDESYCLGTVGFFTMAMISRHIKAPEERIKELEDEWMHEIGEFGVIVQFLIEDEEESEDGEISIHLHIDYPNDDTHDYNHLRKRVVVHKVLGLIAEMDTIENEIRIACTKLLPYLADISKEIQKVKSLT